MDELMKVARDCFYTPIYMKKNRPAYKLSVLCDSDKIELVEDIIFANTSSIGIRKTQVERTILERECVTIPYHGLSLSYKKVFHKDNSYIYPEYQSALEFSRKYCLPIKESFDILKFIYGEKYEK